MFQLKSAYSPEGHQPNAISKLCQSLNDGGRFQTLLGVTGSGKTYTMANIIRDLDRPALVMAPNKTLAAQLYGEMKRFFPDNAVEYFVSYYDYYQPEAYVPATDTYIEKDASINEHIEQMRLSATRSILQRTDTIIVATVSAIYGLGDPDSYQGMSAVFETGGEYEQRSLIRRLTEMQYVRSDLSFERGQYRVRGDLIDIYPADEDKSAYRLSFFDNTLEGIDVFDPLTGVVEEKLSQYTLYPKSHYVSPKDRANSMVDDILEEMTIRVKELEDQKKLLEAQRLRQRTRYDCEMIKEIGYCQGVENYARYLSGRAPGVPSATLLDYLPKDAIVFLDESHVMLPQLKAMYHGDRSRKQVLVEHGFRLPSALDNRPLKFDEFISLPFQCVFVSATPGSYEKEHAALTVEQIVRPTGLLDPTIEIRPASSQVLDILGEINERIKKDERVLITTLTKKMAEQLTEFLCEQGIKVRYLHSDIDTVERVEIIRDLRLGVFDVLVGINLLREGLDMPEVSLVGIFDADKAGFLRSTPSLIQTIGRVARNVKGKAILYGDKTTPAMEEAIQETERRRTIQHEFNQKHNIVPKSVVKPIEDILGIDKVEAKEASQTITGSDKELSTMLQNLEKQMALHAKNLEFEEAVVCRDKIQQIKKQLYFGDANE